MALLGQSVQDRDVYITFSSMWVVNMDSRIVLTDYSNDYVYGTLSEDDGWSGTHSNHDLNGPNPFLQDPDDPQGLIINPSIMDYMQRKFAVGSSLWTLNSSIQSTYFNESGSRNGSGDLLAIITPGGSKSHAVILQSYSNGKYTYYDPQNNCTSTINAGSVAFGVEINGMK